MFNLFKFIKNLFTWDFDWEVNQNDIDADLRLDELDMQLNEKDL